MTDNNIPVPIINYILIIPQWIAPKKSAKIVNAPIHIPPNEAAIGIYLFNTSFIDESLYPTIYISYSLSYLATYI